MGAYYEAAIKANKQHTEHYVGKLTDGEYFRVNTHDVDSNGLKLMEHSYIANSYVSHILGLIENNPSNIIWLCDYTETPEDYTWETVEEVETNEMEVKRLASKNHRENGFIINHTTNEYISLTSYKRLFAKHSNDWAISPLPILTNSEVGAMGGGDLRTEESLRGLWRNHLISYSKSLGEFADFKNVTKDVIIWEEKIEFIRADEKIISGLKEVVKTINETEKINMWDRDGDITISKAYIIDLIRLANQL